MEHVTLTPLEFSVLEQMIRGLNNQEIAKELLLTTAQVEHALKRCMNKTGANTRVELAVGVVAGWTAPKSTLRKFYVVCAYDQTGIVPSLDEETVKEIRLRVASKKFTSLKQLHRDMKLPVKYKTFLDIANGFSYKSVQTPQLQ